MTKRSGGEDKKNSGELGEKYVSNFLNKIGWKSHPSGININCEKQEKHEKSVTRGTHGIDKFFIDESHLDTGRLIHCLVSSKHEKNVYTPSNFKNFFIDLSDTIECYESSSDYDINRDGYDEVFKPDQVVGILFWITTGDNRERSIISELSYRLPSDLNYDRIQIMDNDRVEFITNAIDAVEKNFPSYTREFYYIDTPYNISKDRIYAGKRLPLEMLNCNVLIFKLQKEKEVILVFVTKDKFHPNELKRLLFLSHSISNNLTNNVVILFPSFEHEIQENKNEVIRVKNLFKDKDFIDTTSVYGYNIGFKDTFDRPETTDNISEDKIMNLLKDNGKILPHGEYLRSFINNSSITDSELNIFLKRKGIFICNTNKENMIPFLSTLVLSPKEFEVLQDHHQLTEGKDKNRSSSLDTYHQVNGDDLIKVLKTIDLNKVAKTDFPMYQFTKPIVTFKLDDKNKQLLLEYEIESYYRNKAWDEQISNFKGRVAFDYSRNQLEIISNNIYTSKETYEINRNIINYAKQELKKANIIKNTKENKILMDSLSNAQILKFLLSFTDNDSFKEMEFNNIVSIDMELPEIDDLPEHSDIKWMENHVKKLKLDGAGIEELKIIKEDRNHKYLKCWGIIVEYKIDTFKVKGSAEVKLEFSKTKNNNEFMILIDKYKFDKKKFSERNIKDTIQKEIDSIKHDNYKKIKKLKTDNLI